MSSIDIFEKDTHCTLGAPPYAFSFFVVQSTVPMHAIHVPVQFLPLNVLLFSGDGSGGDLVMARSSGDAHV